MRRLIWVVPVTVILATVIGRLFYYHGFGSSYAAHSPELAEVNSNAFAKSAHLEVALYSL